MSDYPTRPDTPTGSTFWDVAERLLSGLRWERQRVQGDNCIFRRQMAPEDGVVALNTLWLPQRVLVCSVEDYIEQQEELTQDQGQESLPEPDHDSEEEEDEPEVVRTGILELAYPPSPVYAPEESSDSESDSSESSGELRVMELDLERRVEEQAREFEEVSARLRAAQRRLREMMMRGTCINVDYTA
ncbi:hypothetical protein RhiLY_12160 [Ceratobasidium sp. AG-Ba]|nr:hypothetical protein RhiLY_12160 [Ceratobasidium sp. AG-Ba]